MTRITSSLFVSVLLGLVLHAAPGQALSSRTYVSAASGNDANACDTISAPCRTFQAAHDKTNSDGEITVLDPGGYGAVTITKSISIVNDGAGEASILVAGGAVGITINAGAASYINLRGITIQGIGFGGGTGLRFNTGFSLTMENCVIRNHTKDAIQFVPNASSNLSVSNTLLADNGGSGIVVVPTGTGTVKAAFNRVEAYNNSFHGIHVTGSSSTGTIKATVADSVAANNSDTGFRASALAGQAITSFMVVRSVAANNGTGLSALGANATLRVGQSTVTGNTTSWSGTGILRSYTDNNIDGNGDGDPAPLTIAKK